MSFIVYVTTKTVPIKMGGKSPLFFEFWLLKLSATILQLVIYIIETGLRR